MCLNARLPVSHITRLERVFMKHKCSTSSLAQIPLSPSVCLTVSMSVFGSFLVALIHLYRLWCCACYRLSLRCLSSLSLSLSLSLPPSHDGKNICRQQEHRHSLSLSSLSLSHPCDLSGRRRCAQSPALCRLQLMSLCVARANESESRVCFRPERMLTAVETGVYLSSPRSPLESQCNGGPSFRPSQLALNGVREESNSGGGRRLVHFEVKHDSWPVFLFWCVTHGLMGNLRSTSVSARCCFDLHYRRCQ